MLEHSSPIDNMENALLIPVYLVCGYSICRVVENVGCGSADDAKVVGVVALGCVL